MAVQSMSFLIVRYLVHTKNKEIIILYNLWCSRTLTGNREISTLRTERTYYSVQHKTTRDLLIQLTIVYVGFEAFTAVFTKSSIFCVKMPYSPLNLNWFLSWLNIQSWRWRRHVPPKRRFTFNGLYGVISQKIELFLLLSTFIILDPSHLSVINVNS
jgi:hypothetical protein